MSTEHAVSCLLGPGSPEESQTLPAIVFQIFLYENVCFIIPCI